MYVIRCNPGDAILIGDRVTVNVATVEGQRVSLAIDAPREIQIARSRQKEDRHAQRADASRPVD